jgi:hypothetical protein
MRPLPVFFFFQRKHFLSSCLLAPIPHERKY